VHATAAWYLSELGEFKGKQELYTRQSPQRLKALREHALIESAVSSNRIEGVELEPARIRHVLASPRPLLRDRDEEEVRGCWTESNAWRRSQAGASPSASWSGSVRVSAATWYDEYYASSRRPAPSSARGAGRRRPGGRRGNYLFVGAIVRVVSSIG